MPETISQSEWDSVYYDEYTGDYFVVNIISDGVQLCDPFTGDPYHNMTGMEFLDEQDNFKELQPRTLRDPQELVSEAVIAVQSAHDGDSSDARAIDPIDLEFAYRALEIDVKEGEYRKNVEGGV